MMMDRLDELKFHKLNAMVDIVIALVSRPTDAYINADLYYAPEVMKEEAALVADIAEYLYDNLMQRVTK